MPLTRISCSEIREGVSFSAPVFFEDAVNMFLAANHPVKRYHVAAVERWKIPFLVTAGHKNEEIVPQQDDIEDVEEIECLDCLEEVEEL